MPGLGLSKANSEIWNKENGLDEKSQSLWFHRKSEKLREFGLIADNSLSQVVKEAPSQFELKHPDTSDDSGSRHVKLSPGRENKHVIIPDFWVEVLHPRIFKHAQADLRKTEARRPKSAVPINRVPKMRMMHLYPNKELHKINHMHASLDRNLPELVRN